MSDRVGSGCESGDLVGVSNELRARLREVGQEHVLRWWNELSPAEREAFCEQLEQTDLRRLAGLYEQYRRLGRSPGVSPEELGRLQPARSILRLPRTDEERRRWQEATELGEAALKAGRVAALVVAGGQGTRLGFPRPKGLYPIGPVSGCSLFQLFAESLVAVGRRYGSVVPYLVMTSRATHEQTVEFFREHDYFGLGAENVSFFQQGEMPCLDAATGRLLLEAKGRLATAPDGHGGVVQALHRSGLLEQLAARGVDLFYYHHVDNPCVRVCDPAFLGFHLLHQAEVSLKVIAKASATESLGTVVELDGRLRIIEYIDLPDELATRTDSSGNLIFWAGSPGIHVFSRSFFERLGREGVELPWHVARKKVPFLDEQGRLVSPQEPNGLKFERFVFDSLLFARRVVAVEADRDDEFHPIKNARVDDSTPDTPELAQAALVARWRRWLEAAGAQCEPDAVVEVSPLVALGPDDLKTAVRPGQRFVGRVCLRPEAGEAGRG